MKTRVNVEEVRQLNERSREINRLPFESIEWCENGEPILFNEEQTKDWQFIGLNNTNFVEYVIDGKEGVTVLQLKKIE